ncbi:MAG TPA: type II secretion system F family protein [Tepidisphaeraceae bacterium]|jgi:general secretion pathway protein F|nr:type II secretion system F family protein [Tepidisphaeraceae bacterium]
MAVFLYKAIDPATEDVSGTIAADTPRQARELLRERGLIVRDVRDYQPARRDGGRTRSLPRWSSRRGLRHHATTLVRELSTLLGVGVPLLEALDTIARQHKGRFHAVVVTLRDRVSAGASLAAAMGEQPRVFDELCVNITEVGEDAGTLDSSLDQLAEFRERSEQLRGKIGTALIYPAIVSTVAIFASLFLMTFVVPKILQPLLEQGLPLPFPTRVIKGASDFVLTWWWALLSGIGVIVTAVGLSMRSPAVRFRWHAMLLRLPLLGELVRKQTIVHISVVLSTLLRSGVVFVRALQISQRTTINVVLRDALRRCEITVSAGGDIGQALEQTGAFPPLVIQIFALGQQSGRLEEMLERLAKDYEKQVSSAAQRLTAVLEPVLIVVLALFVLFIVMATVLPILEAGNAIQ